ncbi:bacteriocin immunity protein [Pseudomonas sp. 10B1]|uniref:bacteriocin immunity protein n=1 Tax=unclassified Pseudomonas TaxID=196821 RepID=UPI002AB5D8D7|nr:MULTISPECIES: bacteriocin immunity protein [unclassified Pseudomonas]MDY7563161.1 bacteriocin immunity protein [Pseudomonas sp. AB6]MEA9979396.1 bacteriocin immunity protein [Pseudomonas sp. RTS4]MEA9993756.1 bacteriocin immunity protein [Pseudomonas sp. AA4]MEB0085097.1 bacteriocin immunity protein [Pseudomonas sp. RTI1]MEB0125200.1 bacteriocin immunity protein [Pseudomonas sp. CCC1.2]
MDLKSALSEYTEYQFAKVIQAIKDCEGSEDFQAQLIVHLNSLAADAGGSDLIYYPEEGADSSAEGVVRSIQTWCLSNGLPGFKPPF